MPTRILYAVSPIGLGHASRAAAIALKARSIGRPPPIEFATGGPAVDFLRSYGFAVHDVVSEPVPTEHTGEMKFATLWYLRYWFGYRSTTKRMRELVRRTEPSLIVGDEEFSSVSLAIALGIPHVMISDELELGFARGPLAREVERRVGEWYKDLQRRAAHILVPDSGKDEGNVHYISPVVREPTTSRDALRAKLGIPSVSRMIHFSSSGSGIGRFLLLRSLDAYASCRSGDDDVFAITGSSEAKSGGRWVDRGVMHLGRVRDNQDVIAASDLVISTAGKSTIDEAHSSGTPVIAIPIKNHVEQERNAAALGFSFADLERLDELVPRYWGRRTAPARYEGAERAARYILSLLPRSSQR